MSARGTPNDDDPHVLAGQHVTVPYSSGFGGRRPLDLSVYLVTDTAQCEPLGVVETVRRAVSAGVTLVQVRDPAADDAELVALTRAVAEAVDGTGVPVLVNDRVDLVAATGAHGAHVGQGDLDVPSARSMLGRDGYLGLSVHTPAELEEAIGFGLDALDYLGIGPLRDTRSKLDHEPTRGLGHLAGLVAGSPWPCCVIGGVKAADAADLRGIGVAGMAVISAICGQADVSGATGQLVHAWAQAAVASSHVGVEDGVPASRPVPDTANPGSVTQTPASPSGALTPPAGLAEGTP